MDDLVTTLGITGLSKSQVSETARDLDDQVTAFRTGPSDAGPYGYRELLSRRANSAEDGAGWLTFFRDRTARGLNGVVLVASDADQRLVAGAGATLAAAGKDAAPTAPSTSCL